MSNMVEKLEQEKSDKTSLNARCDYHYFRDNLVAGRMRVTKLDGDRPAEVEIERDMTKKTELWVKLYDMKGGNVMLEKKGEWPTNG